MMSRVFVPAIVASGALLLAACGGGDAPSEDVRAEAPPAEAPAAPVPETLPDLPGGQFVADYTEGADTFEMIEGLEARTRATGTILLTGSNGLPTEQDAAGRSSGYAVAIPEEQEALFSRKKVRVIVQARSVSGETENLYGVYSTNGSGNSGWETMEVAPEWGILTFDYDVPLMREAKRDFIGLMPETGGDVEVRAVAVAVLWDEE